MNRAGEHDSQELPGPACGIPYPAHGEDRADRYAERVLLFSKSEA